MSEYALTDEIIVTKQPIRSLKKGNVLSTAPFASSEESSNKTPTIKTAITNKD